MKKLGNALVIIGLVLMLMPALIFGGLSPMKGERWLVSFADDRVFLALLSAVNGIFLITAGFFLRGKKRLSKEPLPSLKYICFVVLFIALFGGGFVGLNALAIADLWIFGYAVVGLGVLCAFVYKERRNRLGIEEAMNFLLFAVPSNSFWVTHFVLKGSGFDIVYSYPWGLAVAFISFIVVKIAVNKIKADRAGDRTLSETEEPGAGSSPAKESEDSGE